MKSKNTNKPVADVSSEPVVKRMEVFEKICPLCGKVISGLIKSQVIYNYDVHTKAHERKTQREEEKMKEQSEKEKLKKETTK